jgi:hypothetical protein
MTNEYADTARSQGLGPMIDALNEAGVPWDIWQSGGWVMVLTVKLSEDSFLGIGEDGGFNLGRYERSPEDAGAEVDLGGQLTVAQTMAIVRRELGDKSTDPNE